MLPVKDSSKETNVILLHAAIKKIHEKIENGNDGEIIKLPMCFEEDQLQALYKYFQNVGLTWKLIKDG